MKAGNSGPPTDSLNLWLELYLAKLNWLSVVLTAQSLNLN